MKNGRAETPNIDALASRETSAVEAVEEVDLQRTRSSDLQDIQEAVEAANLDPSLSLVEYTVEAERFSRIRHKSAYGRFSLTWHFTKAMKKHPDLKSLSGDTFIQAIPWRVTRWTEIHRLAIRYECDKVRYDGCDPLELALELARQSPLRWDEESPEYERFLGVAGWLQVLQGEQPILLPCERLGGLLDLDHRVISHMRARAEQEQLLECVEESDHKKHLATQFRFRLEAFPELRDEGQRGAD